MRILAICSDGCQRQYDVSHLAQGSLFHCVCGEVLEVPRPRGFEATVVRCSACGAPRQAGEGRCKHCEVSFTLLDQDLNTVCPHCMARVGDRARFCHHCSGALAAEPFGGEPSEHACPACGKDASLTSRQLGREALNLLECHRCAGMWLSARTFRILEERAQAATVTAPANVPQPPAAASVEAIRYRSCPLCGQLMHRKNYGRKSGVIVDSCQDHGVWFDHEELDRILDWIRQGGLARANAARAQEAEDKARQRRLEAGADPMHSGRSTSWGRESGSGGGWNVLDVLEEFLSFF